MPKLSPEARALLRAREPHNINVEVREVLPEERAVVHYVSTKEADSYRTVILPDSLKLDRFNKNPVVLFMHEHRMPPIGRNLWLKADEFGVLGKTEFANTPTADELFQLYVDDYIRGWSIGFNPLNWAWEGSKEFDALVKKWGLAGTFDLIFTEVDLYEYSAVTIPANPEALTNALKDGRIHDDVLKRVIGEALMQQRNSAAVADPPADPEPDPADDDNGVDARITELERGQTELRKLISTLETTVMDLSRQAPAPTEDPKPTQKIEMPTKRVIRGSAAKAVAEQLANVAVRRAQGKLD